ncbi:hypothetical protein [Candidatus Aciduliprofundum boonei]|uniref:hypothetical protein n=1 Tax=Candidatus Aciduliprofundum boonei TaxID=379547 RepID=UPI001FEE3BE1|nr:hypothetical protein [Candidatus Aciduliprofundum boonei]
MRRLNKLTIGSKCVIYSVASHDSIMKTTGIFRGFVALGEDTSLSIELGEEHGELKGKIRLIPMGSIAAVDVIELAEEEEEEDEGEKIYYS